MPLILTMAVTLYTARPGFRLDDTLYFVNSFPYSVGAGRAGVTYPGLWMLWTTRILVVASAIFLLAAWERRARPAVESA